MFLARGRGDKYRGLRLLVRKDIVVGRGNDSNDGLLFTSEHPSSLMFKILHSNRGRLLIHCVYLPL